MRKKTNLNNALETGAIFMAILLFFTFYYWQLSEQLPFSSGPDEVAHHKSALFIYDNGRLPIGVNDEAEYFLDNYKEFGTVRSFNPPLPYVGSAIVARALDPFYKRGMVKYPLRKSNVLFAALTVTFCFLAIFLYTGHRAWAVSGSVVFGFLPQFSFLASYLNSDVSAIMVSTLFTYSTVRLYKKGITWFSVVLFGSACGLLLIVKVNAWFYCLPLFIYAMTIFFKQRKNKLPYIVGVITLSAILFGGWWVIFNTYHHGLSDPLNMSIEKRLAESHPDIIPGKAQTGIGQGVGVGDILSNHDDFLARTYWSTVGDLDWLRLKVGAYLFWLYAFVFVISLLYVMGRLASIISGKSRGEHGQVGLELSLFLGGVFLSVIYLYFNIYVDLQRQGKYLIPAFVAVIIFFISALVRLESLIVFKLKFRIFLAFIISSAFIYLHFHALFRVVIPFYHPGLIYEAGKGGYESLDFKKNEIVGENHVARLKRRGDSISFTTDGNDPWILFEINKEIDNHGDSLVRVHIVVSKRSILNTYWDDGSGLSEANMVRTHYVGGKNVLLVRIRSASLKYLRLDTGNIIGSDIVINDIAIAPLKYKQPILARIFNIF